MFRIPGIPSEFAFACATALAIAVLFGNAEAREVYHPLYAFQGGSDGGDPYAGLIADRAGNFFGTTFHGGGTSCITGGGCGAIFKVAPNGMVTGLYAFKGGSDGSNPAAALIEDKAGNLYGTTYWGGGATGTVCPDNYGCGSVFKLSPDGTETVLYAFQGGDDGADPSGSLIEDKHGNLYGTTQFGGDDGACPGRTPGCGTVFRLSPPASGHTRWTETILHAFVGGGGDGANPYAGLIADKTGNLYGTTFSGGLTPNCAGETACGTVFRIAEDGGNFTLLYTFCRQTGCSDGGGPQSALFADRAGNLYGTTFTGGLGVGCCGTVFRLAPNGTESVLHAFGGRGDGAIPYAGVIADKAGNLYGTTTQSGNPDNGGIVFKLAPDGTEKVIHAFSGGFDGSTPLGGLIMKGDYLYGTTNFGGGGSGCPNDCGTIFEVIK